MAQTQGQDRHACWSTGLDPRQEGDWPHMLHPSSPPLTFFSTVLSAVCHAEPVTWLYASFVVALRNHQTFSSLERRYICCLMKRLCKIIHKGRCMTDIVFAFYKAFIQKTICKKSNISELVDSAHKLIFVVFLKNLTMINPLLKTNGKKKCIFEEKCKKHAEPSRCNYTRYTFSRTPLQKTSHSWGEALRAWQCRPNHHHSLHVDMFCYSFWLF